MERPEVPHPLLQLLEVVSHLSQDGRPHRLVASVAHRDEVGHPEQDESVFSELIQLSCRTGVELLRVKDADVGGDGESRHEPDEAHGRHERVDQRVLEDVLEGG